MLRRVNAFEGDVKDEVRHVVINIYVKSHSSNNIFARKKFSRMIYQRSMH